MCNYICLKKETLAVKNMMLWIPFLIFQSVGFLRGGCKKLVMAHDATRGIKLKRGIQSKWNFSFALRWGLSGTLGDTFQGLPDSNFCRCVCVADYIFFSKETISQPFKFSPFVLQKNISHTPCRCALLTIVCNIKHIYQCIGIIRAGQSRHLSCNLFFGWLCRIGMFWSIKG